MSTYSPNLRLELITSGTQAGAWGNTTNTNLGSILDPAISGYITVTATSSTYAFTALYGAADEAHNAIIRLASSYTGAFSVYAPPCSKLYIIYNSTSYTATIYNSTVLGNTTAAGTGVPIPAGAVMAVWSDATNFAPQSTSIYNLALTGVPTAPTAAAATNTTQVATTAFVTSALASSQITSLGVGVAASGTTGEIRATNNITAYYSDERLKTDILPIPHALDRVQELRGVTYRANDVAQSYGFSADRLQVGVLAQDVARLLPEAVFPAPFDIGQNEDGTEFSKSGNNYLTVQYEKIVPLLIEAIKELTARVKELEA